MNVLVVEPGYAPYEKEINGLEEMQGVVGGLITAIYPYEEQVAVVCNDEGILLQSIIFKCLKVAVSVQIVHRLVPTVPGTERQRFFECNGFCSWERDLAINAVACGQCVCAVLSEPAVFCV